MVTAEPTFRSSLCPICGKFYAHCRCDPPERKAEPIPESTGGYKVRGAKNRGIYRKGSRFVLRLRYKGRLLNLGTYDSPAEAREARATFYRSRLGLFWKWELQENRHYVTNWRGKKRRARPKGKPRASRGTTGGATLFD